MPELSAISKKRLATCDQDLQTFVRKVADHWQIHVVCGYRNKEDQNAAFASGNSKRQWPYSLHNKTDSDGNPYSMAVDIAPSSYDKNGKEIIDWEDISLFRALGESAKLMAEELFNTAAIENRIDWGPDIFSADFPDYPHWQIRRLK